MIGTRVKFSAMLGLTKEQCGKLLNGRMGYVLPGFETKEGVIVYELRYSDGFMIKDDDNKAHTVQCNSVIEILDKVMYKSDTPITEVKIPPDEWCNIFSKFVSAIHERSKPT